MQKARLRARGLAGVAARRAKMLAAPAPDYPQRPSATGWRIVVQHYGSGDVVTMDLVPADALGLGRAGQWTVVVNECRLWRCAIGLDEAMNFQRMAMLRKLPQEARKI